MSLPAATERFLAASAGLDVRIEPRTFPSGTKTAADAAAAIGCEVAQIVKSLVFMADGHAVLALVPGDLQLDVARLAAAASATEVRRASLDEVRAATGFAAGGTPPFGHAEAVPVFADRRLRRHDQLWAAAGTPTTVFSIDLADLDRAVTPTWADLSKGA